MKMQITKDILISQKPGNIVSNMDGEKVMLSIQSGKYFNLGEIGGEIWELLKEPINVDNLIKIILSQYDVNQDECEQQVTSFLNRLFDEELIVIEEYTKQ